LKTSIISLLALGLVLAVFAGLMGLRSGESTTLIPVIVVDKVMHQQNPGMLLTQLDGGNGKTATPRKVFKKEIREAEYIIVADDRNGIEYNIKTDKISWTGIKILDTLWTLK
jgi:hypothetical protein